MIFVSAHRRSLHKTKSWSKFIWCQVSLWENNLFLFLDWILIYYRHLKRTLDPSNSVRYSTIPNKAQLELVLAATPRKAGVVSVVLATDTGKRVTGDFDSQSK